MKTTQLLKSVAVATALVGASLSASAVTTDLGLIAAGTPVTFYGSSAVGSFADVFMFTLPANSGSGYNVINTPVVIQNVGSLGTLLTSFSLVSSVDGTLFNGNDVVLQTVTAIGSEKLSFSVGANPAGVYALFVSGMTSGSLGGTYAGSISVTPVPEPENFAMLLAGLGVMGAIARRRKV